LADDRLRVICGPTAAGKSGVALALAERHGATIISADSRQVYRGFDIGTAKPTVDERERVPHYGIDVVQPEARYSAALWAAGARDWISGALTAGRIPLVVGGTGFYLRALAAPLFEEPPLEPGARAELELHLSTLALDELRRWCRALDPARSHLGRTQLLRSILVAELSGVRLSDWHVRGARPPAHRLRYLVVDPGGSLAQRIESRTREMATAGWEDEVRTLMAQVPGDAPAWNATGYRMVRELVEGKVSRSDAYERIVIDTRQYAKRQRTWFRNQLPAADVTRVSPGEPDFSERVESWWNEGKEQ
jgi:tRNA dimethylallyltransferase